MPGSLDKEVAPFNEMNADRLNRSAAAERKHLIGTGHFVIKTVAKYDLDARRKARVGEKLQLYVMRHTVDGVSGDLGLQNTISFMAESGTDDTGAKKRLRIHVPVSVDTSINSLDLINNLPKPGRVFVARSTVNDNPLTEVIYERLAIAEAGSFTYVAAGDTPGKEQAINDEDFRHLWWAEAGIISDVNYPELVAIDIDLTHWRLKPQIETVYGVNDSPIVRL